MPQSPNHSYRPDIDGLRAVAVIAVLMYHALPSMLPGGFFGVDIFFVISGYLITGIIHQQIQQNRFSLAEFYMRRIRRIFPALVLVIAITFAAGWFLLPMREMKSLGANIAGGAIFAQNFILLGQIGYFDLAADKKPLLHLWSLGIEEQYYLVWPLALLGLRRKAPSALLAIVSSLAVASFVLCIAIGTYAPDLAFYLPVTRAWELLAGSALAVWQFRSANDLTEARIGRFEEAAAAGAIAVVAASLFAYRPWMQVPGWVTLLPVLGTVGIIGSGATLIHRRILACRPMVFIGLISYPLYLWHFPLLAYARIHFVDGLRLRQSVTILLVSVILAWLTYRLLECPVRFGKGNQKIKVAALTAAMLALGIVGLTADLTNGLPIRIPDSIRPFMLTGDESLPNFRSAKCLLLPHQGPEDFDSQCGGSGRRPLILIWGDSYAASLYPGLRHSAEERAVDVAQFTSSACPPLVGFVNPERRFCKANNDYILKQVSELRPDVVILFSTWSYHRNRDDLRRDVRHTASLIQPFTKKIVVIGPVASWLGQGLPANVLDYYYESGNFSILPERTWYRSNDNWTSAAESALEPEVKALGLDYISAHRTMCNADGCLARIGPDGSDLTTYDNGHLTYTGSLYLAAQWIDQIIKD
ncbi:acyltransferase family protein [Bradyrhizobium sp. SZCCHNPS1003]|uniref:acyltransferase family protein n=1 Tax=Bradyrhizobium sp. SZCCHNPS1003 TaxID=3057330 RepID=UPI0028ED4D30|nr:acyltransferase family protein [Bradyrhizobium sp. SZCCHNPS1003]